MSRAKPTGDEAGTKAGRRGKRGRKTAGPTGGEMTVAVANHPRARRSVQQIKAWVGLGGFLIALLLSLEASVPLSVAAERGLLAGVAGYLVAWACALLVWRAMIVAELRARVAELSTDQRTQSPTAG